LGDAFPAAAAAEARAGGRRVPDGPPSDPAVALKKLDRFLFSRDHPRVKSSKQDCSECSVCLDAFKLGQEVRQCSFFNAFCDYKGFQRFVLFSDFGDFNSPQCSCPRVNLYTLTAHIVFAPLPHRCAGSDAATFFTAGASGSGSRRVTCAVRCVGSTRGHRQARRRRRRWGVSGDADNMLFVILY